MDTHELYEFDDTCRKVYPNICGIDEAGRGPLCGPVSVGAVILDPSKTIPLGINDSKKLTAKRRENLYEQIIQNALAWYVEFVPECVIDRINIAQATLFGMEKAVQKLKMRPDCILIDGNKSPAFSFYKNNTKKPEIITVVKGDTKSASIAAASILAKVTRDRYMIELDKKYPQYKLSQHKGYPTKLHYELLRIAGVNNIYRRSFLKKWHF